MNAADYATPEELAQARAVRAWRLVCHTLRCEGEPSPVVGRLGAPVEAWAPVCQFCGAMMQALPYEPADEADEPDDERGFWFHAL
jgi:hypothetical protein